MAKLEIDPIKFEIEPLVKLVCMEFRCVHNLANWVGDPQAACNLKKLIIERHGKCGSMKLKENGEDQEK
jgi:hypothetical protein